MTALARTVAGLRGWRRFLVALLLGALAALAFAPLYLLPLLVVGLTGLFWLLEGAESRFARFFVPWTFAWGHFIVALSWIGESFMIDPGRFGWLLPAPVLGLPAVVALFPAALIWLAWQFPLEGPTRVLGLALAWTASEWLRGHLFTGFPWDLVGYVWVVSDRMMQFAALSGVYALSLITVAAAAAPALFGQHGWRDRTAQLWVGGAYGLLVLIWIGGAIRLAGVTVADVPGVRFRLVQADIPVQAELSAADRLPIFERYLQLSDAPGAKRITAWVWPESALPYFIPYDAGVLPVLKRLVGAKGVLFTGADRRTPPGARPIRVWNSLEVVDHAGIIATYDKHHLVPFGEYLPFRGLLSRIGLRAITATMMDFSFGTGDGILTVPGLPPVRALICYEAIFPNQVDLGGPRPRWLLNISNDAWFGRSFGPHQHFAMARVRAIEQGAPLIRAANTGISAVVDPYGRVLHRLGLDRAGVIDSGLPQALPHRPPYGRFGDLLLLPWLFLAIVLIIFTERARRR